LETDGWIVKTEEGRVRMRKKVLNAKKKGNFGSGMGRGRAFLE